MTQYMQYISIGLLAVNVILLLIILLRKPKTDALTQAVKTELDSNNDELREDIVSSVKDLGSANLTAVGQLSRMMNEAQERASDGQNKMIDTMGRSLTASVENLRATMYAQTKQFEDSTTAQVKELSETNKTQIDRMDRKLSEDQQQLTAAVNSQMKQLQDSLSHQMEQLTNQVSSQMQQVDQRIKALEDTNENKLENMRSAISDNMAAMRQENSKKLDEIRGTVDEKLQTTLEKRISESFRSVSDQLEQVYKGLGEMKNIANDVGGLKKVLSGVKTRGILGEIQLGAIIEEILSRDQYETDIATIPGSSERVEFAVRLPGNDGTPVYLPIDSKFPGDRYAQLVDAQQSGDKAAVDAAYKQLEAVLRQEAKDIRNKYVEVPYTTNFGIMFLPFEGLYAEVVNRGLLDTLRRDYHVNIAGPSTMAALLNSLQMGFRTLAIQKRSGEVWEVLGAVKTEFEKFEDIMKKMQGHLNQTSNDLELMLGARTRAINRKLRDVQQLDESDSAELLSLSDGEG